MDKRWLRKFCSGLFRLYLMCSAALVPVHAAQQIHVVTAAWPGFTNEDLSGSYFDYLRLVLPPSQYQLQIEFSNFGRAIAAIEKQQADLTFGLTPKDAPKALRANLPYDSDRVIAIYLPEVQGITSLKDLSIQSLSGFRLAWDLAYNYGEAIGLSSDGYQVASPEQGVSLVINQRVDVYLAEHGDLRSDKVQALLKKAAVRQEEIHQIPVFVGFANNAKGQALKKLWDERLQELKNNGQLAEFYQRHPQMRVAEDLIKP